MEQLFLTSLTRFQDWYGKERDIPAKMISEGRNSGIIGEIEWIESGIEQKQRFKFEKSLLEKYLDYRPPHSQTYLLSIGGKFPFNWKLDIGMFPYDEASNQVRGYNSFDLWFDANNFHGMEGSRKISGAFKAINSSSKVEFSSIHPYERYVDLSDTVFGDYGEPVTIQPMFFGVFWIIFLGSDHLNFFDLSELKNLEAYHVDWIGEELLIQVCPNFEDVTSQEVETEMFRLTKQFKKALTFNK